VGGSQVDADAGVEPGSTRPFALAAGQAGTIAAGHEGDPDPAERGSGSDAAFYQGFGMEEVARSEGYLIMGLLGVELHFSHREGSAAGEAFVMVPDAGRLWKRFKSQGAAGLGPVEDQPDGPREFVVTDPDGNRIRVGSPIPD
jgi:predicted enzyme related to lactoylglutathione lyase